MTDILDQQFAGSPDALASAMAQETVLLHLKRSTYYAMNPLGTQIWQGILDRADLRGICRAIADEHGVPVAQVEQDARKYLEDLQANDIIVAK